MGVLEYTELGTALGEIARVVRPDGLVLVTMLNPVSPYRFVEWYVYWPLLRALGAVEALLNVPPDRRHSPGSPALQVYRACTLRKKMISAGLRPVETVYFDVNFLVPPMDRFVRRWARGWQEQPERTIGGSWRQWLGSAYMVAARKALTTASSR
jgi:SAM-dependent methyltransferase